MKTLKRERHSNRAAATAFAAFALTAFLAGGCGGAASPPGGGDGPGLIPAAGRDTTEHDALPPLPEPADGRAKKETRYDWTVTFGQISGLPPDKSQQEGDDPQQAGRAVAVVNAKARTGEARGSVDGDIKLVARAQPGEISRLRLSKGQVRCTFDGESSSATLTGPGILTIAGGRIDGKNMRTQNIKGSVTLEVSDAGESEGDRVRALFTPADAPDAPFGLIFDLVSDASGATGPVGDLVVATDLARRPPRP